MFLRFSQPFTKITTLSLLFGVVVACAATTQNITVTDCEGNDYVIPLSGSDVSAIDALIQEVTLAADTNGFAKSIYAQMLSKLASLKDILAQQSSSPTSTNIFDMFTANLNFMGSECPSRDDPDQVTSSSISGKPVFGDGYLDDEPRGVIGGLKKFVAESIFGKPRIARYAAPKHTFHSQQADLPAAKLFPHSPEKAANLKVFQGDMVYPRKLVEMESKKSATTASVPSSSTARWTPWNLWSSGLVYWSYDPLTVDDCAAATFRTAASYIEKYTCVRFSEQSYGKSVASSNYVKLTSDSDTCWAYVGMSAASQINLGGTGCQIPGIALHEIGHAIGLVHEHSRMDRDSYVTVDWGEVKDAAVQNFYKIQTGGYYDTNAVATAYDYSSVMHYGACEFSTDTSRSSGCQETLVPSDKSATSLMGQRDHLSSSDIALINSLYGCSATCADGIQNQGEEGVDCGGPCARQCNVVGSSDGILALPAKCAASSARAVSSKEWIIFGAVVGGFLGIVGLGFLIHLRRRHKRKNEAKGRILAGPASAEQIRNILRKRKAGEGAAAKTAAAKTLVMPSDHITTTTTIV